MIAGDIALVIDAMDLMHKDRLDGFCLVSSDSDFTRLAQRLREDGLVAYGFGERKTPEAFRSACNRFHVNCVVVFTKYKEKKMKWWTCGKFFTNGVWYMNNMAECLKYALERQEKRHERNNSNHIPGSTWNTDIHTHGNPQSNHKPTKNNYNNAMNFGKDPIERQYIIFSAIAAVAALGTQMLKSCRHDSKRKLRG